MKKLILICCLAVCAVAARATITTTNTLPPTVITGTPAAIGTNFSAPVIVGYVQFRYAPNFVISHNGLLTTNTAIFYTQISASSATATGQTIATNTFAVTNAASATVVPGTVTVPIYGWVQTVVTNNTTVWQSVITTTP